VNEYLMTRQLAPTNEAFRKKVLTWLLLCEQWPVRVTWILQIIQDDRQTNNRIDKLGYANWTLSAFYKEFVEWHVYNMKPPRVEPELAARYQRCFGLDSDPELFDAILDIEPKIGIASS
jgi:hypothetical protein